MKIVNRSNNTVYVEDIDIYIPYQDGEPQDIDAETLKKSRSLRSYILQGMLDVIEYDKNERIESSLMYLRHKMAAKAPPAQKEVQVELPQAVDLEQNKDNIEVRIHGIFFDAGGYGKVNRQLAIGLDAMGLKVKVDPKRSRNQLNEEELKPIAKLQKTILSRNHILIDSVIPSFAEMSTGKYRILYSTIESYTVPQQFVDACEMYNEIWLTSEWSASILRKYVDKPIYHVVTGADHNLYTENGPHFDFSPGINDFVFISVFGWNYRKGYDVLLKAYFDEFSRDDPVSLLIVSRYQAGVDRRHRMKIKEDIDVIMGGFPNKDLPHVVRYSKITPERDMPKLYRSANCFVLPTRGEGGNLCAPEASLCGLPVIMTNASGQQGYLRPDNAYLLDIDHMEKIQTGQMHLHYWDGQQFPALTSKGTHNQLRQLMRHVVDNYDEARSRNRKLQRLILSEFTWNNTANNATRRLQEIWKTMKGQ